jgi:exosortase family protein XrtM
MSGMESAPPRAPRSWSRHPAVFFVLFVIFFLALQQGYLWLREQTGNAWSARLNTSVAVRLINLLDATADAQALHTEIIAPRARVEIMKGCEGSDVVLLAVAALLAFPLPLFRKMLGLLAAALLIYVVNLIRITSLFFVLAYRPQWFDLLHGAIWQTLIILLVAAFFLVWTHPAHRAHEPPA